MSPRCLPAVFAVMLTGCLGPGFGVFFPTTTDHYDLPRNRIPLDRLQESTVKTPDGETLAEITAVHGDRARPGVTFLHGQGGNIDDAWDKVMQLWDLGFDVAVLDYRGYGESTGEPDEQGLYTDAGAFFEDVAADPRFDATRLVIWGHSLGTGVASELALTVAARALVLEAPFTSLRAMVEGSAPYGIPSGWFTDAVFDTEDRIGDVAMPVVVAHGTEDVRIPFWMGEAVFDHAREPKGFVRAEGADHNDVLERFGPEIVATLTALDPGATP